MYLVTIKSKTDYKQVQLFFETEDEAFKLMSMVKDGDLGCNYRSIFEVVSEEKIEMNTDD